MDGFEYKFRGEDCYILPEGMSVFGFQILNSAGEYDKELNDTITTQEYDEVWDFLDSIKREYGTNRI